MVAIASTNNAGDSHLRGPNPEVFFHFSVKQSEIKTVQVVFLTFELGA